MSFKYRRVLILVTLLLAGALQGAEDNMAVQSRLLERRFDCLRIKGCRALALGESQCQLAVACEVSQPLGAYLLPLDARGQVREAIALPPPAGEKQPGEAVALAYHPQLPLLYLWRRSAGGERGSFEPLLVYNVAEPQQPLLVASACRGVEFDAALLPSRLALDERGRRLYLPNLRRRIDSKRSDLQVGYLQLGRGGMPLVRSDESEAITISEVGAAQRHPAGQGLSVVGSEMLVMAAQRGLLCWDSNNRQAAFSNYSFVGLPRNETFVAAGRHWFYVTNDKSNFLMALRHCDGYPTLMPERRRVPDASFHGVPLVVGGAESLLIVPGQGRLHTVELDQDGVMGSDYGVVEIAGLSRYALLAWSERFDRLYIPVEELP